MMAEHAVTTQCWPVPDLPADVLMELVALRRLVAMMIIENGGQVSISRQTLENYDETGLYLQREHEFETDSEVWRVSRMPRDEKGAIVPQCSATYQHEINTVHCVQPKKHKGGHTDARGMWDGHVVQKVEPSGVERRPETVGEDKGKSDDHRG